MFISPHPFLHFWGGGVDLEKKTLLPLSLHVRLPGSPPVPATKDYFVDINMVMIGEQLHRHLTTGF